MTPGQTAWAQALRALDLLTANTRQLKGMTIRARCGPVRDTFLDILTKRLGPVRKVHPAMPQDALLGGLDLPGTLATGKLVHTEGLLSKPGTLILAMAERCTPDMAALIAKGLDDNPDLTLVMLDEGAEADETAPLMLKDRLAFDISLEGIGRLEAKPRSGPSEVGIPAEPRPSRKAAEEIGQLTRVAAKLAIDTLRMPTLAVHAARTHAALQGRGTPNDDDMRVAAELVLAPRATQLPEQSETPPEDTDELQNQTQNEPRDQLPEDILVDAIRAVLPPEILENLLNCHVSKAKGTGAGQRKRGNRRGRPMPSRPGRLTGTARLDLVATLRAAAPWQTLRGRSKDAPLKVYPSDIHLKRFEERSDRLIIFAVDASGSAALARLAEAKGAVELLLSRAYATRDHVALVAFRGESAQLLLPPTRSLVQAKRRLAELPGGGGTPLAHGLQTATELAQRTGSQGLSPTLVLLTDGRANIALDGSANRAKAGEDANAMARLTRSLGINSIVLDLGARPQPALERLAAEMAGTYLPLPRASAERMRDALGTALDHGLGT